MPTAPNNSQGWSQELAKGIAKLLRKCAEPRLENHAIAKLAGASAPGSLAPAPIASLTVIIPAFNEAASVGDTIRSLQSQTLRPAEIIVVDDCSTDGTGDVARAFSVMVLCPTKNTGSKAGAQ